MRNVSTPLTLILLTALVVGACIAIPEGDGIPQKITDRDDASVDAFVAVDAASKDAASELPPMEPHAVIGVHPSHGPFTGGRLAVIRGNGFTSEVRVWFGNEEVPQKDVTPADPTRIQVVVPLGMPGPVDVRTQNADDESTSRTLNEGYTYDQFYAEPSSGPTTGGTLIQVMGKGTDWSAETEVLVGDLPCLSLTVISEEKLECASPPHAAGSVAITVADGMQTPQIVYDAFTYADSDNGFKGGLSGSPLDGVLKVAAYNSYTGAPIPNVHVIAGDNLETARTGKTDSAGIVIFQDPSLQARRSVTLAKTCFEPTTFVDVPVDTVTAYLSPVLSPQCVGDAGKVPPVGGKPVAYASIHGELVWTGGTEFNRAPWTNVPAPKTADERQVAYLFQPRDDATARFVLPDPSRAITPEVGGRIGYEFSTASAGGNVTLYVLAGIENRAVAPPAFTAYAFGFVQGISAIPGETTSNVYVHIDHTLDQALVLSTVPPTPGPKGPDRLISSVAVQLGNEGYAIFPNAQRTTLLANTGDLTFVGLPGLSGDLLGARFVSSARAVTGANDGVPISIVGKHVSTDTSVPILIDGFVQVPVLRSPSAGDPFDGQHLQVQYAEGGAFVDVTVFRIEASSGLIEWLIVAPAGKTDIELPDLEALGLGLPRGPVNINIYGGHIDDQGFDYGSLVYRQTDTRGWVAYAHDVFNRFY
ncbi:MAG: hypothetical protein CSA75_01110 [Sorangium cellulosum]|nr:MAG: hypothetical protein CSA75_01110 [Sorangium cellulosum]